MKNSLHIVRSEAGAGTIIKSFGLNKSQVLVSHDSISFGPALYTDDLSVWLQIREKFLNQIRGDLQEFSFKEFESNDLLLNVDRLRESVPIVVWIARSVDEQFLLAWIVFLFDIMELDHSRVLCVNFVYLRPQQRVMSIAELTQDQLTTYCPVPCSIGYEQAEELRRVWRTYTSENPSALTEYLISRSSMPFLHDAVCRLVYRYPDIQSGLGVWDNKLLHSVEENGPRAVRVIGDTMAYFCWDHIDCIDDSHLFSRLRDLGNPEIPSPLVHLTSNTGIMRECEVELTDFGRSVLRGEINQLDINPIDEWIGGVHLNSDEDNLVFRDGDSLLVPD